MESPNLPLVKNANRKPYRSQHEQVRLVHAFLSSNQTQAAFAKEHGLTERTLRQYVRRHARPASSIAQTRAVVEQAALALNHLLTVMDLQAEQVPQTSTNNASPLPQENTDAMKTAAPQPSRSDSPRGMDAVLDAKTEATYPTLPSVTIQGPGPPASDKRLSLPTVAGLYLYNL